MNTSPHDWPERYSATREWKNYTSLFIINRPFLCHDFSPARYVTVVDLDGDDDLDVISAGYDDGRLVWYENIDGTGTFSSGQDIGVLDSAQSVVAADVDGDGDMDVVACDYDGGRIVWYENTDGQGTFSAAIDIALDVGVNEVKSREKRGRSGQPLREKRGRSGQPLHRWD